MNINNDEEEQKEEEEKKNKNFRRQRNIVLFFFYVSIAIIFFVMLLRASNVFSVSPRITGRRKTRTLYMNDIASNETTEGVTPALFNYNEPGFEKMSNNRQIAARLGMQRLLSTSNLSYIVNKPGINLNRMVSAKTPMRSTPNALEESGLAVVPNMGNGDCLFFCYQQMFAKTSVKSKQLEVAEMREIVGQSMTQEKLDFLVSLYADAKKEVNISLLSDYAFMRNVTTLEDLRAAIHTRRYFGDEMALDALDAYFEITTLVLSVSSDRLMRLAVRCSPVKRDVFAIVTLDEDAVHYELVTFHGRTLMTRSELPDKIVALLDEHDDKEMTT